MSKTTHKRVRETPAAKLQGELDELWDDLQARGVSSARAVPVLAAATDRSKPATPPESTGGGFGLDSLCACLSLSAFERHLLLLCAGAELDPRFLPFFAELNGHPSALAPSFALAFRTWAQPSWAALSPGAPLRRWALVTLGNNDNLLRAPLALDERVLFYLLGVQANDGRLGESMEGLPAAGVLTRGQSRLAEDLAVMWRRPGKGQLVQVFGSRRSERRDAILAACENAGRPVHALKLAALGRSGFRESLGMLLEREALLTNGILYVETEGNDQAWEESRTMVSELACDVVVSSRQALAPFHRSCVRFDLEPDHLPDLRLRWRATFGETPPDKLASLDRVATQFSLDAEEIAAVRQGLADRLATADAKGFESALWNACRAQARRGLDGLAQRVLSQASWEDLVLPEPKLAILRDMVAQVAQRARVCGDWGFAAKCSRGLGITALFSGESGTGKTLAAEVIANQLALDLYRIDLSQVVSKYIGESEKNLNRVFDAADECGAVLLFDEADALFGRRSEVKDSHDRYANIEVSFLLQRMEAYRGVAILTTNRKSALDPAFTRRIRFIVDFPFPDIAQRVAIWRRAFPSGTPTDDLRIDRLGRLNVTGGQIANIALLSAFMAADDRGSVELRHVLRAARYEFAKIDRPFADLDWTETGASR